MTKKLYRSEDNKMVAGVAGGVAEYLTIDPVVVRLVAIFIAIVTGIVPLALIYLLSVFVVPKRPFYHES
jgi:phage shock protein C